MSTTSEQRELNTGLVIAGAYADKIRRTLFAQLSELVRKDKEFSKEVARASGELNLVLYHVLVNELKANKGDAVRIRINYTVDQEARRVKWFYDTLRVEMFRRVPDEEVAQAVSRVVSSERLNQVLESLRVAPARAEEAVKAFEAPEEKVPEIPELPSPPAPLLIDVVSYIGSVDLVGETIDGGYLVKFTSKEGTSMGVASITPVGNEVTIDAILISRDKCYRFIVRSKSRIIDYGETPEKVIDDLKQAKPTEIPKDQAMSIIREKMQSLV